MWQIQCKVVCTWPLMFMKMLGYVHSIINCCIVEKIEARGIEIICLGFCSYLRSPKKRGHSDKNCKTYLHSYFIEEMD